MKRRRTSSHNGPPMEKPKYQKKGQVHPVAQPGSRMKRTAPSVARPRDSHGQGLLLDYEILHELLVDIGEEGLGKVLETFFRDLANRLDGLRHAAALGDCETFGKLAHALSGSSAAVGGQTLAARCRRAMLAAHIGEANWCTRLDLLEITATETILAIESWPGRPGPSYH